MKWFKHDTSSHRQESIIELIEQFGLEGYARYWLIMEMIAEKTEPDDKTPSLEYSERIWCTFLDCKPDALKTFIEAMTKLGVMKCKKNKNVLKIECPKLTKLRDEHKPKPKPAAQPVVNPAAPRQLDPQDMSNYSLAPILEGYGFGQSQVRDIYTIFNGDDNTIQMYIDWIEFKQRFEPGTLSKPGADLFRAMAQGKNIKADLERFAKMANGTAEEAEKV